jgi:putative DNA primase/helicase
MRGNRNGSDTRGSEGVDAGGFVYVEAKIAELKVLRHKASEAEFEYSLSQAAKQFDLPKNKLRKWVDDDGTELDSLAISTEGALALVDGLLPDLEIDRGNLPATAKAIRDAFRDSGDVYDRGAPVRVMPPATPGALPQIVPLTVDAITNIVHERFRPVIRRRKGNRTWLETETLPERVARLYQARKGEWQLPQLQGITTAPLLTEDGVIHTANGYHRASGPYCAGVPALAVPERPTETAAREALFTLRRAFRTFAFADAPRRIERMSAANGELLEVEVVDLDEPPGRGESTLLCAQLCAASRANLWLAPAVIVNAPQLSGSGSGKGLLLCGVWMIAFGVRPWRFTQGGKRNDEEREKRISAALLEAHPCLLLENVNNASLQSETLESALTDRPARTRPFGKLEMVELYSTASIGITGNGLTPARDLVRKVIVTTLDPRTEVPALRRFPHPDEAWLAHLNIQRAALLGAALTIWRFGRQREAAGKLVPGEAFGSYDQFCRWCRDPLLALGCQDPVGRIHELRAADPQRELLAELFVAWWEHHQDRWVAPTNRNQPAGTAVLADAVRVIADPDGRGPQHLRSFLNRLDGTRAAGFVFERFKDPARPAVPASYRIVRTG